MWIVMWKIRENSQHPLIIIDTKGDVKGFLWRIANPNKPTLNFSLLNLISVSKMLLNDSQMETCTICTLHLTRLDCVEICQSVNL